MIAVAKIDGVAVGRRDPIAVFKQRQPASFRLRMSEPQRDSRLVGESGDKIGITAGLPSLRSGGTNLFKVHTVE